MLERSFNVLKKVSKYLTATAGNLLISPSSNQREGSARALASTLHDSNSHNKVTIWTQGPSFVQEPKIHSAFNSIQRPDLLQLPVIASFNKFKALEEELKKGIYNEVKMFLIIEDKYQNIEKVMELLSKYGKQSRYIHLDRIPKKKDKNNKHEVNIVMDHKYKPSDNSSVTTDVDDIKSITVKTLLDPKALQLMQIFTTVEGCHILCDLDSTLMDQWSMSWGAIKPF
jgi:hypothetical protein